MSYRLSKDILATVTYYDVLDFPLTPFEIWKHLIARERDESAEGRCRLGAVIAALEESVLRERLQRKNGFFFLLGRSGLVGRRIRAEKVSVAKLKRMRRLIRVLAFVPYLRMIGATGSLAMKNGAGESDWDMLVVLKDGRIWTGRTILTGFLHLIRRRRHGARVRDRACLNYFITDGHLEVGTRDLFSAHEYRFLLPLLNFPLFQIFELKNRWMRDFKPNFSLSVLPSRWSLPENPLATSFRGVTEAALDQLDLEAWLARWQKEKIRRNPKTNLEGSLIEASDEALIFLPSPRGPRVFEKFKERLRA